MSKKYWKFWAQKSAEETQKKEDEVKSLYTIVRILIVGITTVAIIAVVYAYL